MQQVGHRHYYRTHVKFAQRGPALNLYDHKNTTTM
jgi:hypothetical protein